MILSATGHRPDKLLGYGYATHHQMTVFAERMIDRYKPCMVISGMALGWDMAIAAASLTRGVPLIAAVPFEGQESKWPAESQATYNFLKAHATRVVNVCEPGYATWKMQARNQWMVDNSECVLALWNGTPGGTANCVRYANNANKPVVNVWTDFELYRGTLPC